MKEEEGARERQMRVIKKELRAVKIPTLRSPGWPPDL